MILSVLFCLVCMMGNAFGGEGYGIELERPPYKLATNQPKDRSYEVREYAAANWTSTQMDSASSKSSEAFMRLFKYIQGRNAAGATIDMTAPVTTHIAPGPTIFDMKRTMSFYIPQDFQADPPAPTDTEVYIEERQPMTAYVRSFPGWASETENWVNVYKLFEDMKRNGVDEDTVDLTSFYTAGYNSPMRFIKRHNEVWLLSKTPNRT
uniref:Heme-binding protein 2-like n=1 Tax=Phallusia mammillata TaxID=59560 RepID=A0A6F9DDV1_9ASCI|nr:heme-binding protein 2-like [Phallusia mammillata]